MIGDRVPIIGGNWKMNTTADSAAELAGDLDRLIGKVQDVEVVLFPPFPNLDTVYQMVESSMLQVGAQDVFWEQSGAYTGEVSAQMLTAVGCSWVITGHSERRHLFGETNATVNRKLRAALHADLQVILAIGETREERHAHETERVLREQLELSLAHVTVEDLTSIVIAYEPVWAIGTGETATPDQAREAHAYVRSVLADMFGETCAETMRIQYGGSVTAANAANLLSQPGIDGALVGGASLKADDFAAIVRAASSPSTV